MVTPSRHVHSSLLGLTAAELVGHLGQPLRLNLGAYSQDDFDVQFAFDWVDASGQTALYGDEVAGRLRLPFDFEFYGETYSAVPIQSPRRVSFGPSRA